MIVRTYAGVECSGGATAAAAPVVSSHISGATINLIISDFLFDVETLFSAAAAAAADTNPTAVVSAVAVTGVKVDAVDASSLLTCVVYASYSGDVASIVDPLESCYTTVAIAWVTFIVTTVIFALYFVNSLLSSLFICQTIPLIKSSSPSTVGATSTLCPRTDCLSYVLLCLHF